MKFFKEILPYLIILVSIILIRTFLVTPVMVDGISMQDTLKDNQILLLKKYDKKFKRFDIVVFDFNQSKLVKRIIGLPGDHIAYKSGKLYINDEIVNDIFANITDDFDLKELEYDVIPKNHYLVLGDNRRQSSDSRVIGLINVDQINGTTNFSLWPFKSIK